MTQDDHATVAVAAGYTQPAIEWRRVQDRETGAIFSIPAADSHHPHLTWLDEPAVDDSGMPLPTEPAAPAAAGNPTPVSAAVEAANTEGDAA